MTKRVLIELFGKKDLIIRRLIERPLKLKQKQVEKLAKEIEILEEKLDALYNITEIYEDFPLCITEVGMRYGIYYNIFSGCTKRHAFVYTNANTANEKKKLYGMDFSDTYKGSNFANLQECLKAAKDYVAHGKKNIKTLKRGVIP